MFDTVVPFVSLLTNDTFNDHALPWYPIVDGDGSQSAYELAVLVQATATATATDVSSASS